MTILILLAILCFFNVGAVLFSMLTVMAFKYKEKALAAILTTISISLWLIVGAICIELVRA